MDSRGKVITLADRLYVSPYLLRPLRRLEEVEKEAARDKGASKRQAKSANDDSRSAGRPAPITDK